MTERIQQYYADITLLITGATGLVGKVLIEKVLRDLPHVRRIYVLIRPKTLPDGSELSAQDRFEQEVLAIPAFDELRKRLADAFGPWVRQRVEVLAGDLSQERLGLPEHQYRQLQTEVQVVINSAAVVSFDAPLDQALEMNTRGPLRVLEFVKGTRGAVFAHISTCYVNGTREGPVPEEPFSPTMTVGQINGLSQAPYDVDQELAAILQRVAFLQARFKTRPRAQAWESANDSAGAPGDAQPLEEHLAKEGSQWAQRRGWNDVYTFTKAMGEQMLVRHRGDVPLLVLRPSIIESALREPEPGWLDGFRMLDPLIVAYGRERLPDFPGNPQGILDVVPVDLVVNALLAAIPWMHRLGGLQVCQVATGMENPLLLSQFAKLVQEHFLKVPLSGRTSRRPYLPDMTFPTTRDFLRRLYVRQQLPLALGAVLARLVPSAKRRRRALRTIESKRSALERLSMYARLYGPYAEVRCQYLTNNLKAIWDSLSPEEQERFNFNMRSIDWPYYLQQVHIGGIRRFLLGLTPATTLDEPVRAAATADTLPTEEELVAVAYPSAAHGVQAEPEGALAAPTAVRPTRQNAAEISGTARQASPTLVVPAPDREIDRWLRSSRPSQVVRSAWRFWLEWAYRLYLGMQVSGLEHVPPKGPFLVVSNHSSHLDTGAILVALKRRNRDLHPLAARDYFFRNAFGRWASPLFLNAAPFDRQSRVAESLGLALGILQRGHSLIFFPEGSRSTTGVMQPFKRGIGVLAVESGVPVVPAYIRGTYQAMPKGSAWPRRHRIHIQFGPPLRLDAGQAGRENLSDLARQATAEVQRAVEALAPVPLRSQG